MVFYEAPHKLLSTLKDMLSVFGNRKISICRELTKIHEQVKITTLEGRCGILFSKSSEGRVCSYCFGLSARIAAEEYTLEDAVKMAKDYMSDGLSASLCGEKCGSRNGNKKK